MDRNCEICKHHTEKGCSKWECQFEPTDSKHEVIEELEKVMMEISRNRDEWIKGQDAEWHAYDKCLTIINEHIAELKGENK